MKKADIGMIGLAVMGENLVMNLLNHGFSVAVFNRSADRVRAFEEGRGRGCDVLPAYSLQEFVEKIAKPRRIMLLIRAGAAVDEMLDQLIPLLDLGDIVIDGGNSNFHDTMRRCERMEKLGFLYVGCGVSGGEEGALHGPSLMPGGSEKAWASIRPVLQTIAAKADGIPCCDWVGENGAGHFVKMVHNGIEYGDMQIICEAYHLMHEMLQMTNDEISAVFAQWKRGILDSYLSQITSEILKVKDEDGQSLVDKILDCAGQKGTGKWTCIEALMEGSPLTMIGEAVFARCLSAMKEERVHASHVLQGIQAQFTGNRQDFLDALEQALYAAKIISYAQGYMLLQSAAKTYGWNLNYGGIALMWRGGCIIRSVFLDKIKEAYSRNARLENLLLDEYFTQTMNRCQMGLRTVCTQAMLNGIPVPEFSSALSFYDGYRADRLPANLLQAQRDYFGAHTYERKDAPRGSFFHTNWTGESGDTSASTYSI